MVMVKPIKALQTLKQHGITEIVVPRKGQMTSSTKVEELKEKTKSYKGGGAKINLKELDQSELPSGYEYPAEVVQPDMSKKLPEQDEQTALIQIRGAKYISSAVCSSQPLNRFEFLQG